jgi:hypothetical protein
VVSTACAGRNELTTNPTNGTNQIAAIDNTTAWTGSLFHTAARGRRDVGDSTGVVRGWVTVEIMRRDSRHYRSDTGAG